MDATTFLDNTDSLSTCAGTIKVLTSTYFPISITNSIISSPTGIKPLGYDTSLASKLRVASSVCWGGGGCPADVSSAGVINADPQLTPASITLPAGTRGPDTYWQPALGSPTIDAGGSAGSSTTVDFLGSPRVRGAGVAGCGGCFGV